MLPITNEVKALTQDAIKANRKLNMRMVWYDIISQGTWVFSTKLQVFMSG